ncbi:MAG: hypothetical protein Q4A27_01790 [bacterium]|nr:hypothetical protein [bacterium]
MLKAKITEDTKLLSDEEEIEQNKDDLFAEMKKAVEEFNIEKFSQKEREYFEEKSRAMGAGIRIIEPEEELDK